MLSFLRFRRGKRDQKRRRSTTSWSPALESLEELILLSSTPGWMTSATSSINVAPARVTATKLVVTTTPPTSVTANAPFGLTVTAENGSGKIATTYNGRVTLALSGGTSGAKLGGTVTITAVNGVAAFTGLTINTAGTGYTLTASSGTLTSAKSSINVAPVTATQLVVTTTPPTSVTANAPFGLTVAAENGSGKIATTYNGRVTLALSGGTSGAKLGGTVTVTAVNGVATFSKLTINTAGTYTLTASSGTLTANSSINVAPAPVTATKLVVATTAHRRHRERPVRPHRHCRGRLGQCRHDLHHPGDARPVQRRHARRHRDRQRRQRCGHLLQTDHQHGRHVHPHRLQRHPDGEQ